MSVDEEPSQKLLLQAEANARAEGRTDVADYLNLRRQNDAIRHFGINLLIELFTDAVMPHMRSRPHLTVERLDGHSFSHGTSNLVGSLLEMRSGVRCLTVEAGWVRGPGDGIMRNGALAIGRIKHFGIPNADQIVCLRQGPERPTWFHDDGETVTAATAESHIGVFLEL